MENEGRTQYIAQCAGFVSAGGHRVREHAYHSETPVMVGSHGICPSCERLYEAEIDGDVDRMFAEPEIHEAG